MPDVSIDTVAQTLEARIRARGAVLGVIGLGYVGLPLSLAACSAGFRVIGFDINEAMVAGLNDGRSPLRHIGDDRVHAVRRDRLFEATGDFARLPEADALLVCVPTPLGRHREPDLSYVESTGRSIAAHLRRGQLVVLESTSFPGTTREVLKPILEATGLRSGTDFYLGYSPEREDPGNADFATSGIAKVVAGDGPDALRLVQALYDQFVVRTVPVSSVDTAEAVKLTENIFRAVNIALVNELKMVFHAMDIDIFEVIDAAKTKPFGYMPFYPGPGLGGHCIPIDPFYLTWKAREHEISTRFIELAGEINTAMPHYVVARTAQALDRACGRGLNGARLLVVGLAYKKNVDDTRESPALAIIELLEARGAAVSYHDPLVPAIPPVRAHPGLAGRRSVPLDPAGLAGYDAVVIVTDHDAVSWTAIAEHARLVVDTRNRLKRSDLVIGA
ncbi:MAG TPA: nucleotide sugar dehydrogenase [Azospirillaceae bacterium]|nr:nucleotide sugar dehydrogenase [Azospirillaceae bacterium]